MVKLRILRWEHIPDYPSGSNVITGVLIYLSYFTLTRGRVFLLLFL